MKLTLIFICVGLIVIFTIIYLIVKKREQYKLLRNVGKFNLYINDRIKVNTDNEDEVSLKYRNHRYEKHKTRNNFLNQKNYHIV